MFIYIVGISRQSPNSNALDVRARAYDTKPTGNDPTPPGQATQTGPIMPKFNATEFTFQVAEKDAALWTGKIGTYAEIQSTSFL